MRCSGYIYKIPGGVKFDKPTPGNNSSVRVFELNDTPTLVRKQFAGEAGGGKIIDLPSGAQSLAEIQRFGNLNEPGKVRCTLYVFESGPPADMIRRYGHGQE